MPTRKHFARRSHCTTGVSIILGLDYRLHGTIIIITVIVVSIFRRRKAIIVTWRIRKKWKSRLGRRPSTGHEGSGLVFLLVVVTALRSPRVALYYETVKKEVMRW